MRQMQLDFSLKVEELTMPKPKYVIAIGACTITRGMFSIDSYSTIRGVDKHDNQMYRILSCFRFLISI